MTARDIYRIGSLLGLALVLIGAVANAQDRAPARSEQVGSQATSVAADRAVRGDLSRPDDDGDDEERSDLIAKKAQAPPPTRMSMFNRVTSTRKEVVSGQSQAARVAGLGGAASSTAAARSGSLHPSKRSAAARAASVDSRVPAGSTWRQQPPPPERRAAPQVRSVDRTYYPTLRSGQHANMNKALVARPRTGNGLGVGMGMGMAGGKSAQTARPGSSSTPARGASSASSPPRR